MRTPALTALTLAAALALPAGAAAATPTATTGVPPATTTAPVPPVSTVTTPTTVPLTTPATTPATTTTPTPTPAPAPGVVVPQTPAQQLVGSAGTGGADTVPAVSPWLVLAAVVVGLTLLLLLLWGLFRWRGWDPPWLRRTRHACAEAAWRLGGTWSEFTDWVRIGR